MSNTIQINTTYNVQLSYQLANTWDRIWAYCIDVCIKYAYLFFIGMISISADSWVLMLVLALPFMFYTLLFELLNDGYTPGKRAMQIQVVRIDGKQLELAAVVLRWLFRIIDLWLFSPVVAFMTTISTVKAQRVGDLVAGTLVISHKGTAGIEQASRIKLPRGYKPVFPEAARMIDTDIELIKEIVNDKTEAKFTVQTAAAAKVESLLGIVKDGSSMEFLKTIVYDYNYFVQKAEGLLEEE